MQEQGQTRVHAAEAEPSPQAQALPDLRPRVGAEPAAVAAGAVSSGAFLTRYGKPVRCIKCWRPFTNREAWKAHVNLWLNNMPGQCSKGDYVDPLPEPAQQREPGAEG